MMPSFLLNLINSKACAGRDENTNKLVSAYLVVGLSGVIESVEKMLSQ